MPRDDLRTVIKRGLLSARNLVGPWRLFGVVVDKRERSPEDSVEYAFEQLSNRFDLLLKRLYHQGDNQRGLIVLDKASQETRLQSLALEFKTIGHRWGVTHNLVDVPLFVDSRATRLIQYADLVAYAMWQKFEKGNGEFFDVIAGTSIVKAELSMVFTISRTSTIYAIVPCARQASLDFIYRVGYERTQVCASHADGDII